MIRALSALTLFACIALAVVYLLPADTATPVPSLNTTKNTPDVGVQEKQPTDSSTAEIRSGENLTSFPKEILSMKSVTRLDLSNNKLSGALPAEIRFLQNLEVLDLSNNTMTGLPAEIGQLSRLRMLNVANNQLTGIPHELGNLQKLEILNLSGNAISEFDLNIIRERLPATTQIIL